MKGQLQVVCREVGDQWCATGYMRGESGTPPAWQAGRPTTPSPSDCSWGRREGACERQIYYTTARGNTSLGGSCALHPSSGPLDTSPQRSCTSLATSCRKYKTCTIDDSSICRYLNMQVGIFSLANNNYIASI